MDLAVNTALPINYFTLENLHKSGSERSANKTHSNALSRALLALANRLRGRVRASVDLAAQIRWLDLDGVKTVCTLALGTC